MPKKILILILVGFSLLLGFQTFAFNITYTSDSDVLLTGPAITVTVLAGSKADTVAVDTATITVTVSNPDTFTIRSNNRYTLANDAGIVVTCGASYSQLTLDQYPGTRTVIITPSATTCASSGGGNQATDTVPPTDTSIIINNNDAETASIDVNLTLGATDAVAMLISGNSDFSGAAWENYATSKNWALISGDGTKTVYVKFRDAWGNISAAVSDSVNLVTTPAPAPEQPVSEQPITEQPITEQPTSEITPAAVQLIRADGDHKVHVVKNGFKRHIINLEMFNAGGYKWSDVQVVAAANRDQYSDVILIRAEGDTKVYRVEDSKRIWIKTAEEFEAGGYKWNEIFDIPLSELNVYPEGAAETGATVKVVSGISSLNIRTEGSLSGKIIGKLYPGDVVFLLGENNGWYNIKLPDGTIGWISAKYAEKQ